MDIREKAARMKAVSPFMSAASEDMRNQALQAIADAIEREKPRIIEENLGDLEAAEEKGIPAPVLKRLKFGEEKIGEVLAGIAELTGLADPLNKITLDRELDAGLRLCRQTCAIGVIGVIFEARPDAMVQVASLCIKSGNCAMLKGGSEAKRTNRKLFDVIYGAALSAGLPEGCLMLAETHDDIDNVLKCHESIDLLIPRGSNEFVQHIMQSYKDSCDGPCRRCMPHLCGSERGYRKSGADHAGREDAVSCGLQRCGNPAGAPGHRRKLLPALARAFSQAHVCLRGTEEIREIIECESASEEDFRTEYLDYIISAKTVENIEEAVGHINRYGSHHTDCILTEDKEAAEYFMQLVDSAGVYCNCSTRFADGFRYGFGAEVGISTGKIHARGPVGLEGLVTYKYKLFGDGHIVADYVEGRRSFHFRDFKSE